MRFIYGMFTVSGRCDYVGNTNNLRKRISQQRSRLGFHLTGRLLRQVEDPVRSLVIEAQIVDAYKRRREAKHNRGMVIGNVIKFTPPTYFSPHAKKKAAPDPAVSRYMASLGRRSMSKHAEKIRNMGKTHE